VILFLIRLHFAGEVQKEDYAKNLKLENDRLVVYSFKIEQNFRFINQIQLSISYFSESLICRKLIYLKGKTV
jgi:hypothetical protein